MAHDKLIELQNNKVSIAVLPTAGASLTHFKVKTAAGGEFDLMRPAADKCFDKDEAAYASMYPILPYVNHIHGGNFVYWGIKRAVPNNAPSHKEPFDGDGWRFAWKVKEQTADKVVLTSTGDPKKGFPFPYSAEVTYQLTADGFTTHLSLHNLGILPMPCALGVHPFFPKTKDVKVKFKNKNVWEHMKTPLRDKPYNASSDWLFEDGKEIKGMSMDTCFGGFDGKAEITWSSAKVKLNINAFDEFNHIILVVPENKSYFSLEPVTSTIDAFNLASRGIMGTGIKSIGPGESIDATVEFKVEDL